MGICFLFIKDVGTFAVTTCHKQGQDAEADTFTFRQRPTGREQGGASRYDVVDEQEVLPRYGLGTKKAKDVAHVVLAFALGEVCL